MESYCHHFVSLVSTSYQQQRPNYAKVSLVLNDGKFEEQLRKLVSFVQRNQLKELELMLIRLDTDDSIMDEDDASGKLEWTLLNELLCSGKNADAGQQAYLPRITKLVVHSVSNVVEKRNNRKRISYGPLSSEILAPMEHLVLPKQFGPSISSLLASNICQTLHTLNLDCGMSYLLDLSHCSPLPHIQNLELHNFHEKDIELILRACGSQLKILVLHNVISKGQPDFKERELRDKPQYSFPNLTSIDMQASTIPPLFMLICQSNCTIPQIFKCSIRGVFNANISDEELQQWKQIIGQWRHIHELALPTILFSYLTDSCRSTISLLTLHGGTIDQKMQDLLLQCHQLYSFTARSENYVSSKTFINSLLDQLSHLTVINLPVTEFKMRQYMTELDTSKTYPTALRRLDINLNVFTDFAMNRLFQRIGPHLECLYCTTFPLHFEKFCTVLSPLLAKSMPKLKHLSLSIQAPTAAGISHYRCHYMRNNKNLEMIELKIDIHLSFEEMVLGSLCLLYNSSFTTVDDKKSRYKIAFEGSIDSNPQFPSQGLEEDLYRDVRYKLPRLVDSIIGLEPEEKAVIKSQFQQGIPVPPVRQLIEQLCQLRKESDLLDNQLKRDQLNQMQTLWL